jgi:hypothetical protein
MHDIGSANGVATGTAQLVRCFSARRIPAGQDRKRIRGTG